MYIEIRVHREAHTKGRTFPQEKVGQRGKGILFPLQKKYIEIWGKSPTYQNKARLTTCHNILLNNKKTSNTRVKWS